MIPQVNLDYMWNTVVNPRLGRAPYTFGGSFEASNPNVGTDCSGAVSAELGALVNGPAMQWPRQFWTGTFAGARPGQTGPFGGVALTAPLVCIGQYHDAPPDAAMIIAVKQHPDPSEAHMICQVGGVTIEMGGDGNTYHTNQTDPTCSRIDDTSEFNQWFYLPGPVKQMTRGVDYSGGRPGGAAIKAAGYSFACRYVFDGSPQLPAKLLTAAEASDLQANGVDVVSNWEASGVVSGGFNQGVSDAQTANANHLAAGGPPAAPIYFSIDYDAPESDQPVINAYFQGVASVIGLGRTGVYGGYWPVKRLFDAGLVTWGWQTEAWSGDPASLPPAGPDGSYLDPRCQLIQRNALGYDNVAGVQCDINDATTDNFGQWSQFTGNNPPPPPQGGGTDVTPELQEVIDKILAYPNVPAIAGRWPSRSMWATDGKGVDDTVGMILNSDGNLWNVEVILGFLIGAQSDVQTIENAAAGNFDPDSYVGGNPWLQARAIDFANSLIKFRSQIVGALAPKPEAEPVVKPEVAPVVHTDVVVPAPAPVVPVDPAPVVPTRNPLKVAPMQYLHTLTSIVGGATAVGTWVIAHDILSEPMATALSGLVVGLTGLFNFLVKEEKGN